jgi:hypothetical protein
LHTHKYPRTHIHITLTHCEINQNEFVFEKDAQELVLLFVCCFFLLLLVFHLISLLSSFDLLR